MTEPGLRIEAEPAFRTRHANPYNALLAEALQREGLVVRDLSFWRLLTSRTDIVHLHWPDLTFLSGDRPWFIRLRMVLFAGLYAVARSRGTRLVWTVHNVEAHEQRATPALRAALRRMLVRRVDGIVALSARNLEDALTAYPEFADVPHAVTPHGHYRDSYDFSATRSEARAALGVPDDVALAVTVGQVRPYKNIPGLLEAFRGVDDARAALAIVGRATGELATTIEELAARDPRVRVDLRFQSDDEIALWLRASDLVVLPYAAVTNSGSALLALSADRPVLLPELGSLTELASAVGPAWVRTFRGPLDAAALAAALPGTPRLSPGWGADLSSFEWDGIAKSTVDLYTRVLAGAGRRLPRKGLPIAGAVRGTPVTHVQPPGASP